MLSLSEVAAVNFVLADGVDLPASEADAWRWGDPSADDVAALAGRLGVAGQPVEVPLVEGGGWGVGDPGTGPSLNVGTNGGWWGSSGGGQSLVTSSDCAGIVEVTTEPASRDGGPVVTVVDDMSSCIAIPDAPPADLPTDEDVLATASAIFGDGAALRVDWRDEWSVSVRADYLVNGQPSGSYGYYMVDAAGWNASGLLGSPELVGRYPTISAADAVGRLTDSSLGMGMGGSVGVLGVSRSVGDVVTGYGVDGSVVEPLPGATEPAVPMPDPVVEPMPMPEPVPEPMPLPEPVFEPTEVVLVAVAATLVPFVDGTGAVWSLPGYVYTDADGSEWEVVAVSDASFDEPTDVPDDVAVDPPVDGDEPVSSDGSGAVVDPSPGGGAGDGVEPNPGVEVPDVVGLGEAEATAVLGDAGYSVRVAERDGETFPLTRDYRGGRVNLVVAGGVVVSVWVG